MSGLLTRMLSSIAAFSLAALSSCTTVDFYAQALHGQIEVLHGARPLHEVETDSATPEKLRGKLQLVQQLRGFARTQLDLTAQKQFGTYRDLHRNYVVWNVYAAPEFSTEGSTWWYPLVGTAKYRGYFSAPPAKEEARRIREEGRDVFVGGVRVYSTLGWFRDPVLNTFIEESEPDLAETLFHELAHARVFIRGDTDFNEAFATAVAEEGVRRWLRAHGKTAELREYERSLVWEQRVLHLLQTARARLEELYAKQGCMSVDEMRRRKAAMLDQLRADYMGLKKRGLVGSEHDNWFGGRLNNARLATVASYHDLVPAFARLLKEQGGDFSKFYDRVRAMKSLSIKQRRQALRGNTGPAG